MKHHAITNGQVNPDDEQDLVQLFSNDCSSFSPVNASSIIAAAASTQKTSQTCEPFASFSVDQVIPFWKRRSFMLKSFGFLGACAASIALTIVVSPLGSSTALAQVQESLKKVRTATYIVTVSSGDKSPMQWQVYLSEENICRVEQPNGVYLVFDAAKKKLLEVNPQESKVRITEAVNVPDGFNVVAQLTRPELKLSKDSQSDQVKTIGSIQTKGFTLTDKQAHLNVWIDPTTDLPLLVERFPLGSDVSVMETWSEFKYNLPLQSSLFSLDAPQGYQIEVIQALKRGDAKQTEGQSKPASTRRDGPSYGFGS